MSEDLNSVTRGVTARRLIELANSAIWAGALVAIAWIVFG